MPLNVSSKANLYAHKAQKRNLIDQILTMSWDKKEHCSARIENFVGLRKLNIAIPRKGNRNKEGDFGASIIGSQAVQQGMNQEEALLLWPMILDAAKNNPGGVPLASLISKIAQLAEVPIPPGCLTALAGVEPKPDPAVVYCTFGGPLVVGHTIAPKFISFLFLNMDNGHHMKWTDMTGLQQYEWFEAWKHCSCTHQHHEDETHGLAGTNLSILNEPTALEAAMMMSPSLGKHRPDGHPI
jgi:hypothetical protein